MPWYTRFWRSKTLRFCDVQLYGFPRLYRRMAELNRYINKNNPKRRESIENGLQRLFRLPTHIYQTLQRWRGVPDPPQGPPSATGHANSGASPAQHPSQQTQVCHIIINKYFLFLWICLYDVFISAKVCVLIFYLFHLLASAHKDIWKWYYDTWIVWLARIVTNFRFQSYSSGEGHHYLITYFLLSCTFF